MNYRFLSLILIAGLFGLLQSCASTSVEVPDDFDIQSASIMLVDPDATTATIEPIKTIKLYSSCEGELDNSPREVARDRIGKVVYQCYNDMGTYSIYMAVATLPNGDTREMQVALRQGENILKYTAQIEDSNGTPHTFATATKVLKDVATSRNPIGEPIDVLIFEEGGFY